MPNDETPKIPEPSRWALAMFRGRLQPCRTYGDWLWLRESAGVAVVDAWGMQKPKTGKRAAANSVVPPADGPPDGPGSMQAFRKLQAKIKEGDMPAVEELIRQKEEATAGAMDERLRQIMPGSMPALGELQHKIKEAVACERELGNTPDVGRDGQRQITEALYRDVAKVAARALVLPDTVTNAEDAVLTVVVDALEVDPPDIDMQTAPLPDTGELPAGQVGLLRAVLFSTIGEIHREDAEERMAKGDAKGAAYAAFTAGTAFEATHGALAFRAAIARYHQEQGKRSAKAQKRFELGKRAYNRILENRRNGVKRAGVANAISLAYRACIAEEKSKKEHATKKMVRDAVTYYCKEADEPDPRKE